MSAEADFTELLELVADLGEVPGNIGPFLVKAIEVTARHVKDDATESVQGSGNKAFRRAGKTIGYDLHGGASLIGGSAISAEVGYRKGGVGNLGNFREFGTSTGQAAHLDLAQALHKNEADLERGISLAIADAEKAAGL